MHITGAMMILLA